MGISEMWTVWFSYSYDVKSHPSHGTRNVQENKEKLRKSFSARTTVFTSLILPRSPWEYRRWRSSFLASSSPPLLPPSLCYRHRGAARGIGKRQSNLPFYLRCLVFLVVPSLGRCLGANLKGASYLKLRCFSWLPHILPYWLDQNLKTVFSILTTTTAQLSLSFKCLLFGLFVSFSVGGMRWGGDFVLFEAGSHSSGWLWTTCQGCPWTRDAPDSTSSVLGVQYQKACVPPTFCSVLQFCPQMVIRKIDP